VPFTGASFLTLRLISLAASLATAFLVFRFVGRETAKPALGVVCAGVFLATWRASGLYFDVARLDSLFCLLVILALYLLRFHRGARGLLAASGVAFLALMTKQTGALVVAPVLAWCLFDDWRERRLDGARGWPLLLCFGAPVVALTLAAGLLLNGVIDEHFLLHVFGAQWQHGIRPGMTSFFFWRDLAQTLPLPSLVVLAWLGVWILGRTVPTTRRWDGFLFAALSGVLLACLIPRLKVSGAANNLIPSYAWLAILFGVGMRRLADGLADGREAKRSQGRVLAASLLVAVCGALQLGLLFYVPRGFVPTAADRAAGEKLLERIAAVEGEVLISGPGYLTRRAGKRSYAHQMPASDFAKSGLPQAAALEQSYARAIREQRFAVIIDSNTAFLRSYLPDGELVRYYRSTGWVFPDASLFVPVSGAPIRPGRVWVPLAKPAAAPGGSEAEPPSP
jgi:hypothetical protein